MNKQTFISILKKTHDTSPKSYSIPFEVVQQIFELEFENQFSENTSSIQNKIEQTITEFIGNYKS